MSSQTKRDFGLFVNKSQGSCKEKAMHIIFMIREKAVLYVQPYLQNKEHFTMVVTYVSVV